MSFDPNPVRVRATAPDWWPATTFDPSPVRVRVTRCTCGVDGLHVWVVFPHFPQGPTVWRSRAYGRRVVEIPDGGELAATWTEAMAFANHGIPPRRIDALPEYAGWCGL